MRSQDCHRQRGPNAVGVYEHFKCASLVAIQEAEQRLGIVTHMVVHVQERFGCRLEFTECARRNAHLITDTGHFEQHGRVAHALEHASTQ